MSYETMMYISIGVGLVFLTISIILFFMFRIPSAISELSGRTARREIQEIMSRESNSLPKGRKIKSTAKKTEKLEDWKVPVTKGGTGNGLDERIVMNSTVRDIPVRDGPVQENSVRSYEIAQKSAAEKPEVQSAGAGNTVLLARGPIRGKDTMPLGDHPPGANAADRDAGDTAVLTSDTGLLTEPPGRLEQAEEQPVFELESQVMIVHSDEIINEM